MQKINSGVTAPKGFLAGGVHCGVKTNNTAKRILHYFTAKKPFRTASSGLYTE